MAISALVLPAEINALSQQVNSAEATAAALDTILADFAAERNEVNGDLAKINEALETEGVDLTYVFHDTETITIKARADDKYAMFDYARFLRRSGRFVLVVIRQVVREEYQSSALYFTLTLTKTVETS